MDAGNQSPNKKQVKVKDPEREKKKQEQLRRNETTRHISMIRGRQWTKNKQRIQYHLVQQLQ